MDTTTALTLTQSVATDPLERAVRAFRTDGRNDTYARYREYLDGDHPLQFATRKYESAFGDLLDALAYDRTNMVVDALADRLHVIGFKGEGGDVGVDAQALWDANRMDRREGEVENEAFAMGDGYLIVERDPETGDVHMWPNDAHQVRVFHDPEHPGRLEFAAKLWRNADGYLRQNLYFPGRIEKYLSRQKSHTGMVTSAKVFERYQPDGEDSWTFDLGVSDTVPVFHFANNARTGRYGVSELLHVLPMQDALNKTLSDLIVAMEFGAYPQRVVISDMPLPPIDTAEGAESREKQRQFELGMDRILNIVGASAKIAEFQATALAQFIAAAEFFDTCVSRISRVPLHYLTMTGTFSSGVERRLAEAPWVAKIIDRQRTFGDEYGAAVRYGLRLGNDGNDPGPITPDWQSAAPLSIEDELNAGMQLQALGVPLENILRGISMIDPEEIEGILVAAEEAQAQAQQVFNAGMIAPRLNDSERVA